LAPQLVPGTALAVGDFDRDGIDTLVAGPKVFADLGRGPRAGRSTEVGPRNRPIYANAEYQAYGSVTAVGDFNGDGRDDLVVFDAAIGRLAPNDEAQYWLYPGSPSGISADTGRAFLPEDFRYLSAGITTGDFDGDGRDDLAVGIQRATSSTNAPWIGGVVVFEGTVGGLGEQSEVFVTEGSPWAGAAELTTPGFGGILASGDLDGDGRDDLVVAAPLEDIGAVADAGQVHIIPGGRRGVDARRDWVLRRSDTRAGAPNAGDRFGGGWSPSGPQRPGHALRLEPPGSPRDRTPRASRQRRSP